MIKKLFMKYFKEYNKVIIFNGQVSFISGMQIWFNQICKYNIQIGLRIS